MKSPNSTMSTNPPSLGFLDFCAGRGAHPKTMSLRIKPLTLSQANELVEKWHRHHKKVQGHRFSLGLWDESINDYVGAAIVGRPVCNNVEQYGVAEVTRLVTNGTKNACSALYGACARVAKEMGFQKIQTYILQDEPGTSLKACGWSKEADTGTSNYHLSRKDKCQRTINTLASGPKQRWAKVLGADQGTHKH